MLSTKKVAVSTSLCQKERKTFYRKMQLEDNFGGHFVQSTKLGKKQANKVSVSRGLNCTRDMAVKYIDELAEELIEAKIATEMVKVEPGKWKAKIDTSKIWAHDETPQFVSFNNSGKSRSLVFGAKGEDCSKLIKENRDFITKGI